MKHFYRLFYCVICFFAAAVVPADAFADESLACSVTITKTNVTCNGASTGMASANPSGGTGPYTYMWAPGGQTTQTITGLSAGTYTVTATDALGCNATGTVSITQPAAMNITISKTNANNCVSSNGTVNAAVTGGTGPYSYTWMPGGMTGSSVNGLSSRNYTLTVTDAAGCTQSSVVFIGTNTNGLIAFLSSVTHVTCNGLSTGAASVSASSGTSAYQYAWTPTGGTGATASGLAAGSYTVSVTSGNCVVDLPVTISQPAALAITLSRTHVSCFGANNGTITATPSGGTAPYTYAWSPSGGTGATASNLAPNTYSVTVTDAKGCTKMSVTSITEPPPLIADITSSSNVTCNNTATGSATVTASGGSIPYKYSWSTTPAKTTAAATGLLAGTYTVTVTDGKNCTASDIVTITEPAALGVTTTVTNVTCNGRANGRITASVTGGTAPFTYSWAPSGSNAATTSDLAPGTYTVTVTDNNGCVKTATATVTQPPVLTSSISSSTDVSCFGLSDGAATVSTSGGTPPYSYNWSPRGGTAATATTLSSDVYSVQVTDLNGCITTSTVAISQPATLTATTTSTNVSCNGGSNGTATVTPAGGNPPFTYFWSPVGGTTSNATGLPAGSYTVTVTDIKGCQVRKTVNITQPTALTYVTTNYKNTTCGSCRGEIDVVVVGGVTSYNYNITPATGVFSWDATGKRFRARSMCAGNYTVTITDANGCTLEASWIITNTNYGPATINSFKNVSCFAGNDGAATAGVIGGKSPYTYEWLPGGQTTQTATNLSVGTYTVTVADKDSCLASTTVNITQPAAPLSATVAVDQNVTCFGGNNGSATAAPSGGTAPYTYTWSTVPAQNSATAVNLTAGTYTVTVKDLNNCQVTRTVVVTQPPGMVLTTTTANATCAASNGQASVAVSSGTGPYSYSWLPSGGTSSTATGLPAGSYTVSVTDASGCSQTATAIVSNTAAPSATVTATAASCNGSSTGSATVSVAGGTPTYTYAWAPSGGTTNSASNLAAGNYTVTVRDANNCVVTATTTITQPAALASTITKTNVSCNGGITGSATVAVTGGTGAYTYAWSPAGGTAATASNLGAGTYTVNVTDVRGCTHSNTVTITQPSAITASITSTTAVTCNGGTNGSATAAGAGGTPGYSYSWAPSGGAGASGVNLSAGTYTVTVTDQNGCAATAVANISQPAAIAVTTTQTNASCNGGSNGTATASASGGTLPYTYLWSPVGGTNAAATGLSAGSYTVTVTDANNCQNTGTATITQPAALSAIISASTNASCSGSTNGSATVTAAGGTSPYTYSWSTSPTQNTATANNLAAGSYTVTVTDNKGCIASAAATITQPTPLSASAASTAVSCNAGSNGTATVAASGGTGPYTYAWSPGGATTATASGLTAGNYTVTVTDSKSCAATATVAVTQPTALSASISSSANVSCSGGSNGTATVSASGGTPAYTYTWLPSGGASATAANLSAGTFTVTATDSRGCTATATVSITQPAALTATTAQTNVSCFGSSTGSATVTPSGGTSPFTYFWSPTGGTSGTASGLPAGSYTATITDSKGCSITRNITITQPSALAISSTQTNVSCNGGNNGAASVTVTGGTLPYTFSWTPNASSSANAINLTAGTYSVSVTDGKGCSTGIGIIITEPAALVTNIGQTNVSCFGGSTGSATANVSGGTAPYTYSWSPGGGNGATVNNLTAGIYTVTVTDNRGCQSTANANITQPSAITTAFSAQTNASCNGGTNGSVTVTATGGTSPYTYFWTPYGGTSATGTNLGAGTFTVTITDASSCQKTATVTISQPAALTAAILSQTNVSCFNGNNGRATVTAAGGTAPYTYSWSGITQTTATVTNLTAGTYTVTLTDAKGCAATATVTITEPTDLTASAASTDVSCNGGNNGSATVTASGGAVPYTYNWSPSGGTAATASNLTAGAYTATVTDANGCTEAVTVTITQPAALTATISSKTNASCNGGSNGSATVTAAGGTAGYTFSWSPSGGTNATATGLAAGTYTVTIIDTKGCQATAMVSITQPSGMTLSTSAVNATCGTSNGQASVGVTGGTAPYTYLWNSSPNQTTVTATGLPAANYIVTVTDNNNCSATANVSVNNSTGPSVTTSVVNHVSCYSGNNGSATATATGGTGSLTYAWAPSGGILPTATGLGAGTFTVTVRDANGCIATSAVSITEPSPLTASTSHVNATCNGAADGSSSVIVVGGTGPYTYSWSPSGGTNTTATGLQAATYTVTATDAKGCTVSSTVAITQPTAVTASITSTVPVTCFGGTNGGATVAASGGTPGYTYSWSPSGGIAPAAQNLSAGQYTVTVTDSKGCIRTATATVTQPSALLAAVTQTNASCNGASNGSATVIASGGSGSFTYFWSPYGGTSSTANNLGAGTFTVTVTDANSCQRTATVTITEPSALTTSIASQTNVSCFGSSNGSATVSTAGGTVPYTYYWSTTPAQTGATATALSAGTYNVIVMDAKGCTGSSSVTINQPTELMASATTTNVSCNGGNDGSSVVAVSGGTPGYSYNWTPTGGTSSSVNNFAAGSYTVTVGDANGCTKAVPVTITQPSALIATISSKANASCNGVNNGTATVSVSGGTAGYTYTWSPSGGAAATATGLAAGNYTVTVTDNKSCQATASVTITQPASLTVTTSKSNVTCRNGSDGSASVSVAGGTLPYTYSWAPAGGSAANASGLAAGTYTVTITDAKGCVSTVNISITEPPALTASISSSTNIACFGTCTGSAQVTVGGGSAPYTYSWSPGNQSSPAVNNLCAGSYTVMVTDANNCAIAATVAITQPAELVSTSTSTNITCAGACDGTATTVTTGGTGPYTFLWSPGLASTPNLTDVCPGTYSLTITDANGCTAASSVNITEPTGISVSTSAVQAQCNNSDGSACIAATGGVAPLSYLWNDPQAQTTACATNIPAGSYVVVVTDANGCFEEATVNVNNISGPTVTIPTTTNVTCAGAANGTATAAIAGGTSPYAITWSAGAASGTFVSGLAGGIVTITVTDATGCTTSASVNINEPPALSTAITSTTDVSCNLGCNGAAIVSAGGGTQPYTYRWNDGQQQTTPTAANLCAGTYAVTVSDANGCFNVTSVVISQPDAIVVSPSSVTHVSCNGGNNGAIAISVNGGTPGYTYTWQSNVSSGTNATNLTAGTYSVTVTDSKGCTGTSSSTINEPSPLLATITSVTNATCNGSSNGSATVSVTGGRSGYQYSWLPSGGNTATASNLAAGTYTVTATDINGCTATATVSITEPAQLTAVTSHTNVSCSGAANGTTTVTASGGTPDYTYQWSSGSISATATGLTAGQYNVTVTDANGCSVIVQETVGSDPGPTTSATVTSQVECFGACTGAAQATVTGGTAPYNFMWSPGSQGSAAVNNLCAGTYTVTVTDANGCTSSTSVSVSQPTEVTAIISSSNVTCADACNGSATAVTSGGTGPYTFIWNPGFQVTPSVTGMCAGTYSLNITDDNGCSTAKTVIITEPTPIVLTTSNIQANCGNSDGSACVSVSGGIAPITYQWNDPQSQTTACAANIAAGIYNVTVTDGNNCQQQATVNVNNISGPVVTITSSTGVTCAGANNGTATASITGGTGPYTISWTNSTSVTDFASDLPGGVQSILVTDDAGCIASASVNISEPQSISSAIISSKNASCFLSCNGEAVAAAGGGTAPYAFLWNDLAQQTTSTATSLCAGSYFVTITDANGCSVTNSVTITQPADINVTATSLNDVKCYGQNTGSLAIAASGGTAGYTYAWEPSLSSGSAGINLPAGTYTIITTDAKGCTDTSSFTLSQPDTLVGTASSTPSECGSSSGTATIDVTGGAGSYTYSWSDANSQTTPTAYALAPGTYSVTVTDANNCSFITAITVSGSPAPVVDSLYSVPPTCNGTSTGSATIVVSGGTPPYFYSWNDPSSQTGSTAGSLTGGTYSVTVTDGMGCSVIRSIQVVEPAPVQAVISANDSSLCQGQSVQLFAAATGGTPGFTFTWSTGYVGNGPLNLTPAQTTIYSVTAVDANGCSSAPSSITVAVAGPLAVNANSVTACDGQAATISAVAAGGLGGPYTYTWSNGYIGQTQDVTLLLNQSPVTFTVTVSDGCSSLASDTMTVTVVPVAAVNLLMSDTIGCEPFQVSFTAVSATGVSYVWDFGDGTTGTGEEIVHTYTEAGGYPVSVTVENALGCKTVVSRPSSVFVKESPTASFSVSPSVNPLPNATTVTFSNQSTDASTFYWTFGDGGTSNDVGPQHYYSLTGDFLISLIAENTNGCRDTFTMRTTSEAYIKFPNAFTPNPDGPNGGAYDLYDLDNNVFRPVYSGVEEYHLVIFNKWGELIFESFDVKTGWDGYFKGELCKQDVYVWKVYATFENGAKYNQTGDVTLLR